MSKEDQLRIINIYLNGCSLPVTLKKHIIFVVISQLNANSAMLL